jgi:toxin ParE1/3/4
MARIIRTRQSREDVIEIWEYIARDSALAADKLLRKFDETVRRLSEQPLIGAAQDKYRSGLRSFPVGKYVIFYEVDSDGITIIRVLHGARDWPRIIDDE